MTEERTEPPLLDVRLPRAAREIAKALEDSLSPLIGAHMMVIDAVRGVRAAQSISHQLAEKSGWWTDLETGERIPRERVNLGEKLCLIHSEISEAMEGARKGLQDTHLPHLSMLEVELADVVIRIFDLAGFLGLDVSSAMFQKLAYNQSRPDHKIESRKAEGGKTF